MNEYPDLSLFLQNLWLRENDIGLKAIEGKGGYSNGKYYPYRTANGNIDVGPGFDMEKQTPEFRKRAAEGFTKEELDNMVLDIARNELPYFRKRIIREGGDPDKVTDAVYNGLLDMYWQLNNGLYGYDKFWKAVAGMDYEGMRNESATYYPPKNGKIPKGAIVKDGKILDTGRWDFRKDNYFKDPEILDNTVNDAIVQTSPIMEPVFDRSMYVEQPNVIRNYKPVIFPSDTRIDVRKGMQDKIDFNNFMDSIRIQNNLQTYNPPIQFNNNEATESNQYDKGGSLKFPQWDNLSVKEKADIMKVAISNGITNLSDIRQRYNAFAEGGDIEPEKYYATMEKVANENYNNWGFNSSDEALTHALNDNTYDYRGYYNKYPQSNANADTHWTDEFKTVYHPTFSDESIYSGKKSQFNPYGLPGGFWAGDSFIPRAWQLNENNRFGKGGNLYAMGTPLIEEPVKGIDLGNYSLDDMNEQQLRNLSTDLFFKGDLYNAQIVADRVNAYSAPRVARMNRIVNASQPLSLPEVTITPDTADRAVYQEEMNQPYFQIHEQPSFEEWKNRRDLALQAQGELKAMPSVNPIVDIAERGLRNYVGELKYDLANNKVPGGKYTLPAAIATAAGLSYVPTVASKLATSLTPGSSFWMNPLTQQIITSTAAAEGINAGTRLLTGYNSVGDVVGSTAENLTGWNPNNTWLGPLITESLNPGWYASPTGVLGIIGNTGNKIETTLGNTFSKANRAKTKRLIFGNEHQPNIIQRALGKPNKHDFSTWGERSRALRQNYADALDRVNLVFRAGSNFSNTRYVGNPNDLLALGEWKRVIPEDSKYVGFLRTESPKLPETNPSTSFNVEGKFVPSEIPTQVKLPDGTQLQGTTQTLDYKLIAPDTKTSVPLVYGNPTGGYDTQLALSRPDAPYFPNVYQRQIVYNVPSDSQISFPVKNSEEFTAGLQKYVQELESEYGYPVVGSTRSMSNDYFGGIPGDTEIIVPKGQVQDASSKLGFNVKRTTRGDTGVSGYSDKAFIGKDNNENLDINILDDNGTIIHQLESTRNPNKMPALYDDLAKQQANAGRTSHTPEFEKSADLAIPRDAGSGNYSAEEYFNAIKNDKELLDQSVVDNLFKSHSEKHVKRAYVMMNNDNPDAVKKVSAAIDHMVAQIPKMKRFSKLYPSQKFDNVEKNKEMLEKIGFVPFDIDKFASNPEQMKNIVDYWYMRKTVGARSVNYEKGPGKTNSFEEVMQAMRQLGYGSSAGGGGNEILGNTFGGYTRDYVAYNYHDPMLDKKTATFDDVLKYFEREKNIWKDPNTKDIIRQVFKEHGIDLDMYPTTYDTFENARDYSYFTDDVYSMVYNKFISPEEGDKLIRDVSERLGVGGYRGEPYGSHNFSEYGDYYGAMQRPGLSGKNSEPLSTHRNIDSGEHNRPVMPAEWGSDDMFIRNKLKEFSEEYSKRRNVEEGYATDPNMPVLSFEDAAKQYPNDFIDLGPHIVRNEDGSINYYASDIRIKDYENSLREEAGNIYADELKNERLKRDWENKVFNASSKYKGKKQSLKNFFNVATPIGLTAAGASYIINEENKSNREAIAALKSYVKDGTIEEVRHPDDGSFVTYTIPKNEKNMRLVRENSYFKQLLRHGLLQWVSEETNEPNKIPDGLKFSLKEGLEDSNQKALGGNLYTKGGPINPFVQKAIKYFMDRGFTDYQAAGLVGNLMRESSMNPNAINRWSNAFGLAQWLGERKAALFAMYGPKPTFEQQLDFIWHELNTTHKNGLKYLLASRNAEEAARNAMGYYEFSAGPEGAIAAMNKYKQDGQASMDKGIAFANQFYGYYNPKSVVAEIPVEPLSKRQSTFGINPVDNTYVEKPRYYDIPMSTPVNEQYSAEALARQQASDNINTLTTILGMMDTRSQNSLNNILQYLV